MRFYGVIGFGVTEEDSNNPGVWTQTVTEKPYYGEVTRFNYNNQQSSYTTTNNDITINNSISIVADAYCMANFQNMLYVEWLGTKWQVKSVEVQRPRLILSIGGVYNGES